LNKYRDYNNLINFADKNVGTGKSIEKFLLVLDKACDEDKFCGLPLHNKLFYLSEILHLNMLFQRIHRKFTTQKYHLLTASKPIHSLFTHIVTYNMGEKGMDGF
jgi:hypothetical protein